MNLKPYPSYKPSGVEWLGDVPQGWEILQLKYVTRMAYGDSLSSENRIEGEVPVFGSNGIVGTHCEANTSVPCLIVGRKGSYGKVNYSDKAGFAIDTTYFVDNTQTKQNLRWLFYLLSSSSLDSVSQDTGVPGLSREDAYSRRVVLPPLTEQKQIADFLDRETARIDGIIEKQERLIALLTEKRSVLISDAVTKGINPNVKLKRSGVEWLGDVPEGWEVKRLRFAVTLNPSKQEIKDKSKDELVSFLPMEAIGYGGSLNLERTKKIGEVENGYTFFSNGDVTIAKITPCFENGKGALMRGLTNGCGFGTTELTVLRPSQELDAQFLFYLSSSCTVRRLGEGEMFGSGGQKRVPDDFYRNLIITLPPLAEQKQIADFLDAETAKMDDLTAKARKAIELMKEHRSALIAAAVTGQIDVRNA